MSEESGAGEAARLAAEATGGEAPEASMAEAAEAAESAEESKGVLGALMETEPDDDPRQHTDWLPPEGAELFVGMKKMAHGLGMTTPEGGDGTPAIVHFGRAAKGGWRRYVAARQAQAQQEAAEAGGEPEVVQGD